MKLSCWAISVSGHRPENQDAVVLPGTGVLPDGQLASTSTELTDIPLLVALADGVGGRPDGRWAARTALAELTSEPLVDNTVASITAAISNASRALAIRSRSSA